MAISLRREIEGEWALVLAGILSVIFGIILAVLPGVGLLSLVWLIGIHAILFGIALMVVALRARGKRGEQGKVRTALGDRRAPHTAGRPSYGGA